MPEKKFKKSLFIFRRDLRLDDNTALNAALAQSGEVLPVFIFDPRQTPGHEYFSAAAFNFMLRSLGELDDQLRRLGSRLHIARGRADEAAAQLVAAEKIQAVFCNKDYTPFSIERDLALAEICRRAGAAFMSFDDALLHHPEEIFKKAGGVYTVFTPYFRKASLIPIDPPAPAAHGKFCKAVKSLKLSGFCGLSGAKETIKAGRKAALSILRHLEIQKNYPEDRDNPAQNSTTHLSAHLKFGTCSAREVYDAVSRKLGPTHPLIRSLHWRDFFVQIGYHHPYVLGRSFNEKYETIAWENDENKFAAWREGKTGFPIVDAGMRELKQTGFMHNRCRMITASFLVKDLHIDWRWGEKYFAQKLVDYDPLVNNGNWQWAASTGCDAQPYFRIFNPWLQQRKFDPDCAYIKKWIVQLKQLRPAEIHALADKPAASSLGYPRPLVNHASASLKSKSFFRDAQKKF